MAWWRKREAPVDAGETPTDANQPVIRLENVSKVFEGDADEKTRRSTQGVAVVKRAGTS